MSSNNNTGMNTNMSKFYVKEAYTNNYKIYELTHHLSVEELALLAKSDETCVGFNTLGFLKYFIDVNHLNPTKYYTKETDGLYVFNKRCGGGESNLYTLADKYRLDKTMTYGHNYIPTYHKYFKTRRNSTKKV